MADKENPVLVTGVSRGIGAAIAEKLLADGWRVIGTYNRNQPELDFAGHSRFEPVQADFSDPVQVEQKLKPLIQSQMPEVLVNNAGISENCDVEDSDEAWLELWDRTQQINLRAAALLAKWHIPIWKDRKKGRLINIASRAAYRGDTADFAAYAASKAGMVAFGKSLLRNYGKYGIEVYAIAPGFIKTDMAKDAAEIHGEEYITSDIPMGYLPEPDQVGETAAFLAEGKAPQLSGSTIHLNGGSYMI